MRALFYNNSTLLFTQLSIFFFFYLTSLEQLSWIKIDVDAIVKHRVVALAWVQGSSLLAQGN